MEYHFHFNGTGLKVFVLSRWRKKQCCRLIRIDFFIYAAFVRQAADEAETTTVGLTVSVLFASSARRRFSCSFSAQGALNVSISRQCGKGERCSRFLRALFANSAVVVLLQGHEMAIIVLAY